jgi:hypothetical protein
MNAAAVVVWFLFNANSGQLALRDEFPSQVDCQRGASVLHQIDKRYQAYVCHPMTVTDPWVAGATPAPTIAPTISSDPRAIEARAQRNYQWEEDHINDILSHPPQPVQ